MAIGTPVGEAFVEVQGRLANNFQQTIGSRIGGILGVVGRVGGVALAGGVVAGAAGIGKAVGSATDLAESINAVNVVFGDSAGIITDFAETAAREVGLSARAVNQLVTPIGAMFQNAGLGAEEAAQASVDLTRVAADMASVFNVDVADALGAVQAGLRGEADPLERFGVGLSAANVQAFALKEGLIGQGEAMTEQIKAQARLGLIMEQTASIQGDFANTSDSAANQQRILSARMEETSARIGTAFLPIWEKILAGFSTFVDWAAPRVEAFINDHLVPALNNISVWWDENGPRVMAIASEVFGTIGTVIGNVIAFVKDVFSTFQANEAGLSTTVANIGGIIKGLAETVTVVFGAIRDFWAKWGDEITELLFNAINTVAGILKGVFAVIRGIFEVFAGIFTGDWTRVWEGLKSIFKGIWNIIASLVQGGLTQLRIFFGDWIDNTRESIGRGVNQIVKFFQELPGRILNWLKELPGQMVEFGKSLVTGILTGIGNLGTQLFNKLKESIGGAIQNAKEFFGIGSPSKFTAKIIGFPLGQGITAGFEQGVDGDAMLSATQRAVGTIAAAAPAFPLQATGTDDASPFAAAAMPTTVVISLDPDGKEKLAEFVVDWGNRKVRQVQRAG